MTEEEILEEITDIAGFCEVTYDQTNGEELSERLTNLNVYLARTAQLEVEATALYDARLADVTIRIADIYKTFGATERKNIANGEISTHKKLVELCERLNKTIVHSIDGIRSQLSYLKTMKEKNQ